LEAEEITRTSVSKLIYITAQKFINKKNITKQFMMNKYSPNVGSETFLNLTKRHTGKNIFIYVWCSQDAPNYNLVVFEKSKSECNEEKIRRGIVRCHGR